MKTQPLPNLKKINQQLAGDVNRVEKFLESLPFHIEMLLEATKAQDWPAVQRQSEQIAKTGDDCNLQEISLAARAVQKAIDADNHLMAGRAVVRLVARCGTAKLPSPEPNAKLN